MTRKKKNDSRVSRHPNRNTDKHTSRSEEGTRRIMEDQKACNEDYNLSWFKPTHTQKEILYSMCDNELTLVQGGSGCGKSTTAIWQALKMLKKGEFRKVLFIKTPSEDGHDQIGFLSGSESDKLTAHMQSMRSIFTTFMSKEKLAMEEKKGRIEFSIPNFKAGETFYNSVVILDESQKMPEDIIKMFTERLSDTSKIILLGDKGQRYAARKRQDGFTSFVNMVTAVDEEGRYSKEEMMGYVEMTSKDNMRGKLSKRIGELYEEKEED